MIPLKPSLTALLFLAPLALLPSLRADPAPPVARVAPVSETLFGQVVTDPYRWMEQSSSPEFQTYLRGQADFTRVALDELPGRAALLARIAVLDRAGASVRGVQQAGENYFYRKALPGDNNAKLYVRAGLHGTERVLLDPQTLTRNGVHLSIDYVTPSPDGSRVAVGLSAGGSEASTMRILRVADGAAWPERIDRTDYAQVSWEDNGRAFYYSRLQKLSPDAPATAKYQNGVALRHVVGTDPSRDTPVFGFGVTPAAPFQPDDVPILVSLPGCDYLFGVVARGVQNENAVYAVPRRAVHGAATPWQRLADFSDDVVAVDGSGDLVGLAAHGGDVFLLTHHNAPRYKIIRMPLKSPDLAHAETIVSESHVVIRDMAQAKDALYVQDLDGGVQHIRRVTFAGQAAPLPLPFDGSAYLGTDPRLAGALLTLTSWTRPAALYTYNPQAQTLTDTGLLPAPAIDVSGYVSEEVSVKSPDGISIPLSIIHQKGILRDGSHPTLLSGYGSYGITREPAFDPVNVAWLERGGVLAVAHVRGGGEYGEDWHQGGQKLTKHHTWEDFLACGHWLIDHGYTTSARLAGQGRSAGGITVGRALTAEPSLFAAMLDDVGASNTLRSEFSANGPSNIPEFGTVTDADGFRALYDMDATQHVQNGVAYPAVLLTTGVHDPRVESWEPAKMAAHLQAATTSGHPVLLRVDYDAGHGIGSTKSQREVMTADQWAFLLWQFGDPVFQPKPE